MQCPDCGRKLVVSKGEKIFVFHCSFCGYNKRISAKNADEAYQALFTSKTHIQKPSLSSHKTSIDFKKSKLTKQIPTPLDSINLEKLPLAVKKVFVNPDVNVVLYKHLPQQLPESDDIPESILPKPLIDFLRQSGFKELYKFQIEALTRILEGKNIVVVAPTGTGKTEAFLFPLLTKIWQKNPNPLMRRGVQAILIYPTKALARDQLKKIQRYGSSLSIECKVFDGDTPQKEREQIYQYPPDILITNPDMLHYHLSRPIFQNIIRTVHTVVVDEIHTAIGAFGSNLYFILKRLARITQSQLQCIGASATIGNAKDFATQLFDTPVELISLQEARKAPTHLLMVQPRELSQYTVIAELSDTLIRSGRKTLCFQNNHKNAEIVNILLRQRKIKSGVHRAGLTKKYRETIEKQFRNGELDILVSTPTLELGIDIGDVDAVVSSIVEVTRFTQRLGRAGRRGQEAIGVLLLREDDPISTFYSLHPETYFEDVANGYIEPNNEIVSYYQILAAALDKPIKKQEFIRFQKAIQQLVKDNLLRTTSLGEIRVTNKRNARHVLRGYSIRGIGDTISIKTYQGIVIGERSMPIAARELHPGAIYIHGGKYYKSISFDYNPSLSMGEAIVKEIHTQNRKSNAIRFAIPEILNVIDEKKVFGLTVQYCDLEIIENVVGYTIEDIYTSELINQKVLDPPIEYTFKTKGFVFRLPKPKNVITDCSEIPCDEILMGAFHAVEHVLIESSSMLTGGGSSEIGGISMGDSGVVFVYDGAKGGSGLSKLLYDKLSEGIQRSLEILIGCSCTSIDGCPRCTYSYQCGNNNQPLHKMGAIETLQLVVKGIQTKVTGYDTEKSFI
ncbi:MAG: DEAD/DEAH box helicase [Candidatus Heimdallarchaeaceae archaeon]